VGVGMGMDMDMDMDTDTDTDVDMNREINKKFNRFIASNLNVALSDKMFRKKNIASL
jgi:hypothetical protein